MRIETIYGVLFAMLLVPTSALAQTRDPSIPDDDSTTSDGRDIDGDGADEELTPANTDESAMDEPLPESKSDDDVAPPVASPGTPAGMVVRQAGIGGQVGYGRAGVLELGGSAGFTAAGDFTAVNVTPSIGWFVADNLQMSGRVGFNYVSADGNSGSLTTALVEPSYHLPFNRSTFGFVGMGMGGAYVSDGGGLGFALAPRIGANFMVGRSGVLTPAFSWQYTTHDSMETNAGTLLVVSSQIQANIGYTVMW